MTFSRPERARATARLGRNPNARCARVHCVAEPAPLPSEFVCVYMCVYVYGCLYLSGYVCTCVRQSVYVSVCADAVAVRTVPGRPNR